MKKLLLSLALVVSAKAWIQGETFNDNLYQLCKAHSDFSAAVYESRFDGKALSEWIDLLSESVKEANNVRKIVLNANIETAIAIYSKTLPELSDIEQKKWILNMKDKILISCLKDTDLNEMFNKKP